MLFQSEAERSGDGSLSATNQVCVWYEPEQQQSDAKLCPVIHW